MSGLPNFIWPFTLRVTRHCEYHKEHGHTTDECRHLYYLVEDMVRTNLLSQYIKKSEMSATRSSEQGATDMIQPRRAFPVIHVIQGEPVDQH